MTPPLNDSRDDWAVFGDMLAASGDVRGGGINAALRATPNDVAAVWLPLCNKALLCRLDGHRCDDCEAIEQDARRRRASWGNLEPLPAVTVLTARNRLRASLGGRRRHGKVPHRTFIDAPDAGKHASYVVTFNADGSLDAFILDINARRAPF